MAATTVRRGDDALPLCCDGGMPGAEARDARSAEKEGIAGGACEDNECAGDPGM